MSKSGKKSRANSKGDTFSIKVFNAFLKIPGTEVDRTKFLRNQFESEGEKELTDVIQYGPLQAGIPLERIDQLADGCINSHVWKATLASVGTGTPGIVLMPITVPADIAQSLWHIIVLTQKLVYLYGQDHLFSSESLDELMSNELEELEILMMASVAANRGVNWVAARLAGEVPKRLARQPLTKTVYYPLIKRVAKWLGISVTKQSFAKTIGKVIPVVGGVVSGGFTYAMFKPKMKQLKEFLHDAANKHLRKVEEEKNLRDTVDKYVREALEKYLSEAANDKYRNRIVIYSALVVVSVLVVIGAVVVSLVT